VIDYLIFFGKIVAVFFGGYLVVRVVMWVDKQLAKN